MTKPRNPRRTHRWAKLRAARLAIAAANQEPCAWCGQAVDYTADGRTKWGPTIDHQDPLTLGGDPYPPLDQLQVHHRRCGGLQGAALTNAKQGLGPGSRGGNPTTWQPRKPRKAPQSPPNPKPLPDTPTSPKRSHSTAQEPRNTPTPPRPDLIHQISGPPCAGKSTWIQQHAQPADHILDDQQLAHQHGGRDNIPPSAWHQWRDHRAQLITTWTGPGHLWYTVGDPAPLAPGITVTLLDPGQDQCHTRADNDGRPAATHDWIDTWYTKHGIGLTPQSGAGIVPVSSGAFPFTPRQHRLEKTGIPVQVSNVGHIGVTPPDGPASGDIPRHETGFALPRIWTPAPGDGDYEMADAALAWAASDSSPVPAPKPWQAMVLRELLSCSPGGAKGEMLLRHSMVVLRCSRQQGKTVIGQIVALWMLRHGREWLGDVPRIINTHTDGKQAVEMLKPVAERLGYGRNHGGRRGLESQVFMAVWHPWGEAGEFEPVWTARAMTVGAMTGQKAITTAIVDELQDVRPAVVKEALGGAMSAAHIRNRLKLFMGTGEKPDSEYLRRLKVQQLGQPRVLWAEWSVPPGTDHGDEGAWEWASPDWSGSRAEYVREERRGMDADEFNRNYLLDDAVSRAEPRLVDAGLWASAAVEGLGVPRDRLVLGIGFDVVSVTFSVVAGWVVDRPGGGDAPRVGVRLVGVFGSQGEAVAAAEGARGQACRLWLSENLRGQVQVAGVRETIAARDAEAEQALVLGVQRLEAGLLVHGAADDGLTAAVLGLPVVRVRRRWEAGKMALLVALVAARPSPRSGAA